MSSRTTAWAYVGPHVGCMVLTLVMPLGTNSILYREAIAISKCLNFPRRHTQDTTLPPPGFRCYVAIIVYPSKSERCLTALQRSIQTNNRP